MAFDACFLSCVIGECNRLLAEGKIEKIYRCMDIVELEVREISGYEAFCIDHCTDSFQLVWTYEFDSLFLLIALLIFLPMYDLSCLLPFLSHLLNAYYIQHF